MFMNDYQKVAQSTAVYPDASRIIYPAVGLAEEAGEVCGKVKRILRDDGGVLTPERKDAIVKELGDVLWYVAALSTDIGVTLDEVASQNIRKLAERKAANTLKGEGDVR